MKKPFRNGPLTLVELLVVIAIIGISRWPNCFRLVQAAREAARRMHSVANNLKQLGLAILNYESASKRLPSGYKGFPGIGVDQRARLRVQPFPYSLTSNRVRSIRT